MDRKQPQGSVPSCSSCSVVSFGETLNSRLFFFSFFSGLPLISNRERPNLVNEMLQEGFN